MVNLLRRRLGLAWGIFLRNPLVSVWAVYRYCLDALRLHAAYRQKHAGVDVVLYCFPHAPLPMYTLWAMCKAAGIRIEKGTRAPVVLFDDRTVIPDTSLPPNAHTWINGRCRDIRKSTVSMLYSEVFGHELLLDPAVHRGPAVEKSEINGSHDGRIVMCPHERRPGMVYQKLVDNSAPSVPGHIVDHRVFIIGDQIPLVFEKTRPVEERFHDVDQRVRIASPSAVYSEKEISQLLELAKKMGLDVGEMDTLRDKESGELYVVDVNKTSVSPPLALSYAERKAALERAGTVFLKTVLRRYSDDIS